MIDHALVTVEIVGASSAQRRKFYIEIESLNWIRVNDISTTWTCSLQATIDGVAALNKVRNDINAAKTKAKINTLHYAIQVGDSNDFINV